MQDETQRPEPVVRKPPQPAPRPAAPPTSPTVAQQPVGQPAGGQPVAPAPASAAREPLRVDGPVSPRGLENLRTQAEEPRTAPSSDPRAIQPGDAQLFHPAAEPHPYPAEYPEPMYLPLALSVGAGFKFGCGLMMAVGVSLLGLFLIFSVAFFVASLAGIPFPGTSP